ncbi:MAG: hypothetical protein EPN23_06400 [Verrucomicrobia bacterium]|nr:MAG: hypothetical protein EPN23_06400 [Verrucomicrobiota bacterium]
MKRSGQIMLVVIGGAMAALAAWWIMRPPPQVTVKVKAVTRSVPKPQGTWVRQQQVGGGNYGETPAVSGAPAIARVQVAGQPVRELIPNQEGAFPQVPVRPGEKIMAEVTWPEAKAGDEVLIQMEDGGTLGAGAMSQAALLNEHKGVAFEVHAPVEAGTCRVALSRGEDRKVLEFEVVEGTTIQ